MSTRTVTTQAELDAALAKRVSTIIIDSPRGVWLTISDSGSATVRASGSATVEAWGSATVAASGSATVRAWDSATVEAWDSATVEAWDSATVRASGSATVRAWGSATVEASKWVAVHLFSARATVSGGVVIDVSALDLDDLATWIAYHGATVTDGALTAYKAVGDDWQTDRKGWVYAPGATVVAEDWDGKPECGGGLHLCLTPRKSRGYYSMATRYVECLIDVTEAVVVDRDKVKARSVRVVREVTIDGEPVTA